MFRIAAPSPVMLSSGLSTISPKVEITKRVVTTNKPIT